MRNRLLLVAAPMLLATVVIAPLGGCASAGRPPADAWERIYGAPVEVVWREVLELLADESYAVESADRGRGRIRAESATGKEFRELVLDLEVIQVGEVVKVTVEARTGAGDPSGWRSMERAVLELLTLLDDRVRATRP